jgi:hypothetical protein
MGDHRGHDRGGNAGIFEGEDVAGAEAVRGLGVLDEGEDHLIAHSRPDEFDHISHTGRQASERGRRSLGGPGHRRG